VRQSRLSATDVDNVSFATAAIGRRGYAKAEVDRLLRRTADTLRNTDDLTAAEVHHVEFTRPFVGKRGYDEREVDLFLDRLEDELLERSGARVNYQVPQCRSAPQDEQRQPGTTANTSVNGEHG